MACRTSLESRKLRQRSKFHCYVTIQEEKLPPRAPPCTPPLLYLHQLYALTTNGKWVAEKLERASAGGKEGPQAAASPILNRSSYASSSERDGGGGGGTAASPQNGHSPLAPTRAGGAAVPGVRLLIDNREKRGATGKSQVRWCAAVFVLVFVSVCSCFGVGVVGCVKYCYFFLHALVAGVRCW